MSYPDVHNHHDFTTLNVLHEPGHKMLRLSRFADLEIFSRLPKKEIPWFQGTVQFSNI